VRHERNETDKDGRRTHRPFKRPHPQDESLFDVHGSDNLPGINTEEDVNELVEDI
jgi:hypothetical protein